MRGTALTCTNILFLRVYLCVSGFFLHFPTFFFPRSFLLVAFSAVTFLNFSPQFFSNPQCHTHTSHFSQPGSRRFPGTCPSPSRADGGKDRHFLAATPTPRPSHHNDVTTDGRLTRRCCGSVRPGRHRRPALQRADAHHPCRDRGLPDDCAGHPPRPDGSITPEVLYCAKKAGATHVLKAGGAQAVAAMAWGTGSCPKVDKIMGPGNQYVTAAKMLLQNSEALVAIDMPAGPSEVLVIADGGRSRTTSRWTSCPRQARNRTLCA